MKYHCCKRFCADDAVRLTDDGIELCPDCWRELDAEMIVRDDDGPTKSA